MEISDEQPGGEPKYTDTIRDPERKFSRLFNLVWVGLTVALLLYVLVGSVPAHSWRWNVLRQRPEERVRTVSVTEIWARQRDSLPSLASDAWTTGLFNLALILFVVGASLGLRFALRANEESSVWSKSSEPVSGSEQRVSLNSDDPVSASERTGSQTLA